MERRVNNNLCMAASASLQEGTATCPRQGQQNKERQGRPPGKQTAGAGPRSWPSGEGWPPGGDAEPHGPAFESRGSVTWSISRPRGLIYKMGEDNSQQ